ncbi:hypothetical protein SprV_0100307200 [Sparganum proliferum]
MVRQPKRLLLSSAPTVVPYLPGRHKFFSDELKRLRDIINRLSTIFDAIITRLPQMETNVDLDVSPSVH